MSELSNKISNFVKKTEEVLFEGIHPKLGGVVKITSRDFIEPPSHPVEVGPFKVYRKPKKHQEESDVSRDTSK